MSVTPLAAKPAIRHDWTLEQAQQLRDQPFMDLLSEAQRTLRAHFPANQVQLSTLLSIKTGSCPEDCRYCSQSAHYNTGIEKEKLIDIDAVLDAAKKAKAEGASRFCMGGAWRSPPKKAMSELAEMIKQVKAMGMETCLTAGMLNDDQAKELKGAGLDYYNHNLDTSESHYNKVITTRTYQDRLDTLEVLRSTGIKTCCGGILGLGEGAQDRLELLVTLANLPEHPESVPLNLLVPIEGTPLGKTKPIDTIEFVKMVAVARIMMPTSMVRLSAGRNTMSESLQALCFMAGANSIHYGEKLLTTPLPGENEDMALLAKLGITPMPAHTNAEESQECSTC